MNISDNIPELSPVTTASASTSLTHALGSGMANSATWDKAVKRPASCTLPMHNSAARKPPPGKRTKIISKKDVVADDRDVLPKHMAKDDNGLLQNNPPASSTS